MNDVMILAGSFLTGAVLGVLFFGGLWWTVLRGVNSRHPGILFSLSMVLRTGITLVGFVLISQGQLNRLALCLLGFFAARGAVMRKTRYALEKPASGKEEAPHET